MKGHVYILTNPSMPGIVKVGRTSRTVHGRAGELYQTGVPTPFVAMHYVTSPDCVALERAVHEDLAEYRIGQDREFFRCEEDDAKAVLDGRLLDQVSEWLYEFLPEYTLAESDYFVDSADLYAVCRNIDANPMELASAIHLLDPNAALQAIERQRQRYSASRRAVLGKGGIFN